MGDYEGASNLALADRARRLLYIAQTDPDRQEQAMAEHNAVIEELKRRLFLQAARERGLPDVTFDSAALSGVTLDRALAELGVQL